MAGSAAVEHLLSHSMSFSDEYVVSVLRSMHFSTSACNAAVF